MWAGLAGGTMVSFYQKRCFYGIFCQPSPALSPGRYSGSGGPRPVRSKKVARKVPVPIDYFGIEVGNEFLMGYGLDYFDLYRNTNYVFVPEMSEVKEWDKILGNK